MDETSGVEEYLDNLPEERRALIKEVRGLILRNLPEGYHERIEFGMLSYSIPLERYPNTYNGKPLLYLALASQKNYCSLYLMSVYASEERTARLKEAFRAGGKKLDMGKSCVRFRKLDDLPLEAIGRLISEISPEKFIETYEAAKSSPRRDQS